MKSCPVCHATYPRDFTLCPRDGTKLVEVGVWSEGTLVRGKYRIIGKIGEGGMATVFKAMHVRFEELRALKVISSELSSDSSFIKRLQQEAVVTRRLQHPNAVRVEDIDEAEDGRPFIVMEYIEGRSLKDVIEEAPLPVDRTMRIAKQVAAALDAAHALGILHRDIKPANIVLIKTPEGEQAKVLDFGIAKVKETNLGETAEMTLTGKGRVVGTSAYMSPEQAMGMRGDELDGRSDLYSLGVVMYQMLVGELPLKAESEVTMLIAHIQAIPKPIKQLRPELPDYVADLVMRLLEKKRELRPASGRALIEEIERWERGEIPEAAPAEVASPEQTVLYREALKTPHPEVPPPPSPPAAPEPFPAAEATVLASGFGAPRSEAPTPPPLAGAEDIYPAGEATVLASGFGRGQESPPAPPPELSSDAAQAFPPVEATMLASGFGSTSSEPSPPLAPVPSIEEALPAGDASGFRSSFEAGWKKPPSPAPTFDASEAYPPGEATMLASSLAGKAESTPASGLSSGPVPSTAERLAAGASVWNSATQVASQGARIPSGPAEVPVLEQGPAAPQSAPARKSSWLLWVGVPVAAIVLTVGAWYVLTQTGSSGGPSQQAPSSTTPETTTPASNTSGGAASAPQSGQPSGQPSSSGPATSGSSRPPGAEGAAGAAAAGAGETTPAETKPAEGEAAAPETKAVDWKAVQALKSEGDLDYDKGLYDDALRAYRKALKLDPGNRVVTHQIARVKKAQQTEKSLLK